MEKRCTVVSTDLDNNKREQEAAKSANDYDERRLHHTKARLQQKQAELDRERRNLESMREREAEITRLLEGERNNLRELESEVRKAMANEKIYYQIY